MRWASTSLRAGAPAPLSIQRIYVYQWRINSPTDRFDAGVVNPDGSARKSYGVLLKNKSQFK